MIVVSCWFEVPVSVKNHNHNNHNHNKKTRRRRRRTRTRTSTSTTTTTTTTAAATTTTTTTTTRRRRTREHERQEKKRHDRRITGQLYGPCAWVRLCGAKRKSNTLQQPPRWFRSNFALSSKLALAWSAPQAGLPRFLNLTKLYTWKKSCQRSVGLLEHRNSGHIKFQIWRHVTVMLRGQLATWCFGVDSTSWALGPSLWALQISPRICHMLIVQSKSFKINPHMVIPPYSQLLGASYAALVSCKDRVKSQSGREKISCCHKKWKTKYTKYITLDTQTIDEASLHRETKRIWSVIIVNTVNTYHVCIICVSYFCRLIILMSQCRQFTSILHIIYICVVTSFVSLELGSHTWRPWHSTPTKPRSTWEPRTRRPEGTTVDDCGLELRPPPRHCQVAPLQNDTLMNKYNIVYVCVKLKYILYDNVLLILPCII